MDLRHVDDQTSRPILLLDNRLIMITKSVIIVLLIAIMLFRCTSAAAGSVEIGFVDDAGLDRWIAGGPAEVPIREMACIPATFTRSSTCRTVVIFSHSSRAITISFTTSGEEFSTGVHGGAAIPATPKLSEGLGPALGKAFRFFNGPCSWSI
jgi:hypothetical protein